MEKVSLSTFFLLGDQLSRKDQRVLLSLLLPVRDGTSVPILVSPVLRFLLCFSRGYHRHRFSPRVVHCHCSSIFSLFPNFLSSLPLFRPSFEYWSSLLVHFVLVTCLGNQLTFPGDNPSCVRVYVLPVECLWRLPFHFDSLRQNLWLCGVLLAHFHRSTEVHIRRTLMQSFINLHISLDWESVSPRRGNSVTSRRGEVYMIRCPLYICSSVPIIQKLAWRREIW